MRLADLPEDDLKAIHEMIFRYLRSLGVSHHDAEDATQGIMVKLLNREIDDRKKLLTAARHLYFDWWRRKNKWDGGSLDADPALAAHASTGLPDPSHALAVEELVFLGMQAACKGCRLVKRCTLACQLIVWRNLEEKTLKEMAEILGEHIANIDRWYKECLARFRQAVKT